LIFVVFLFPLTLYCLILALINSRQRPLAVSGVWDFAGVLFAASGLLLAGGPSVMTGLNEHWRMFWLLGRKGDLADLSEESWLVSLLVSGLYFLVVLLGSAVMLWRRRRTTSIYNVEPAAFETTLTQVLEEQGLTWTRRGKQLWIAAPIGPGVLLEVDAFPALRHVLLFWAGGSGPLRQQVEDGLREGLGRVHTEDNPAGSWFLWTGACLFLLMIGILVLLLTIALLVRH
jgi:hypothetical protein